MKQRYLAQVVGDARLTPEAVRVILHVVTLGPGEHAVKSDDLEILLHGGEKPIRKAITRAVNCGYLAYRFGGRSGHYLSAVENPAPAGAISEPAEKNGSPGGEVSRPDAENDSRGGAISANDAAGGVISLPHARAAAAPTTTPAAATRGSARDGDLSFQHLRVLLGAHADVLDRFNCSAPHSETWPAAVWGLFRPPGDGTDGGGTDWAVLKVLPSPELQREALAQAMEDFAAAGHIWKPRFFRGFVLSAVQSIQLREKRLAAGVEEPVPRPARSMSGGRPSRSPQDEPTGGQYKTTDSGFQGFNR